MTVTGVIRFPAAAEGKHLQEKGTLSGRSEGRDGRSWMGGSEHLHPITWCLILSWGNRSGHLYLEKNPRQVLLHRSPQQVPNPTLRGWIPAWDCILPSICPVGDGGRTESGAGAENLFT